LARQGPEFSDAELVALMVENQSWALAELYDRYVRLVFSLALKLLGEHSAAEEIVQEVFAKVWQNAHTFDAGRGKFSTWLVGITHNHCVDEMRRRRSRPIFEPVEKAYSTPAPTHNADTWVEQSDIGQALAQIPEEQRFVIHAAYFQGLTMAEIASLTEQPLGTVKTRLRLGLQKLKSLLSP
jgi:RNA polymerase sigma-70 factor (ECF subfamily)